MNSQIKVLSKTDRIKPDSSPQIEGSDEDIESPQFNGNPTSANTDPWTVYDIKLGSEAETFKLIDDRDWNIATSEPSSESGFFIDGHPAMSIISVIGTKGTGKSTLLNKIAMKEAFKTYKSSMGAKKFEAKHITRGIDIHTTHHRMLLDSQPLLAPSVLEDFLTGYSNSQFQKNSQISDPMTSCHMISMQLATFLIATSDYVIIVSRWLIDVHLLKLLSSAIMMIGENNVRAKFVLYSQCPKVRDEKLKILVDNCLGKNRVVGYFDCENELIDYISPYSSEKCHLFRTDPSTFTGKNWLSSCNRLWNTTIKNSSMFSDYALQLYNASNINI